MARALVKAGLVLTTAAMAGVGAWVYATEWRPSPLRYPLQGVDLGEAPPGPIDWGTVRAQGADFAYIVATSGADRRDPAFEANWAALPPGGLRRGAVHLYSLCQPGAAQANAFNAFVPRTADALPVAVDISYRLDCAARPEPAALRDDLRRFTAMVESHSGRPVVLRIARDVESDYALSGAIDRPLWVTGNFLTPDYTARPWRLWRASDVRRIGGIDGPVNWDVVAP